MTNGLSRHRRRSALSISSPVPGRDPVARLDQVVEILHQINRALPQPAPSREELIALGGLLTQVSGALLTFTELLGAAVQHDDRTRAGRAGADAPQPPSAAGLLRDCGNGFATTGNAARALHAELKRELRIRMPCEREAR